MPSFAWITITGHLGRDPITKEVSSGTVCEFSVAVSTKRGGEEHTDWYRCSVWGKRGETASKYLTKGKAVTVTGSLIAREYEKDGQKRTSLDIHAFDWQFAGGREDAPSKHREERVSNQVSEPNDMPAFSEQDEDQVPF